MLTAIALAASALVIDYCPGGRVDLYADAIARETRPVQITGLAVSACTMYLGAKDVCVTPNARFEFHPPAIHGARSEAERQAVYRWAVDTLKSHYPPAVANWYESEVISKGGFYVIKGSEMIRLGVKAC